MAHKPMQGGGAQDPDPGPGPRRRGLPAWLGGGGRRNAARADGAVHPDGDPPPPPRARCRLGADVAADAAARLPFTPAGRASYAHDWTSGAFVGILAPAAHVTLLSLIPALAFGEQAAVSTGGAVTGASILASTALFGVAQALAGGQPLMICGVAEPLVLVYSYLASFASRAGVPFLPFAAWTCAWAAAFLAVAALAGAGRGVRLFTRFSADLFGALVGGALFMQQAVAIVARQFRGEVAVVAVPGGVDAAATAELARAWRLANGAWSLFIAAGLTITVLATRRARAWSVGPPALRAAVADVAAPLGVLAWSGLAYAVRAGAAPPPPGLLPRPLELPAPWDAGPKAAWGVAGRMGRLGGKWAAAAALPGAMVALLFFFDHTIVQRVALPEGGGGGGGGGGEAGAEEEAGAGAEENGGPDPAQAAPRAPPPPPPPPPPHHHKPATYAWDLAFLSLMTLAAGLSGLPPVNGVLPQAPMHAHALGVADRERRRRLKERDGGKAGGGAGPHPLPSPTTPPHPPLETRVAALLQSLAIGAAAAATPLLSRIPQAVIAGYFAYMSLESLEPNQFAARVRYLAAHPSAHPALRTAPGAPACLSTVPHAPLRAFTLLQVACLVALYAWTWIPLGGVFFPVLLMGLVPVRAAVLPRWFSAAALRDLDAADFEEAAPARPPLPTVPSFTGLEPVRVLSEAELAARVRAEGGGGA